MLELCLSQKRSGIIMMIGILKMLPQSYTADASSNTSGLSHHSTASYSPSVSTTMSLDSFGVYTTLRNDISPTPIFTDARSATLFTSAITDNVSESISRTTSYASRQGTSSGVKITDTSHLNVEITSSLSLKYQQTTPLSDSLTSYQFSAFADSAAAYSSANMNSKSFFTVNATFSSSAMLLSAIMPVSVSTISTQTSSRRSQSATSSFVYANSLYSSISSAATLTKLSLATPTPYKFNSATSSATVHLQDTSQISYYLTSSSTFTPMVIFQSVTLTPSIPSATPNNAVTPTASISSATQNSAVKLTPSISSAKQDSTVTPMPSISSATQNSTVTPMPSISSATQNSTVTPTPSFSSATQNSAVKLTPSFSSETQNSAVTTTASISLATQNSAVKLTPSFSSETQNSAVTLTPSISSATQNSAVTLKPSISSATQKSTVIPTTSFSSATQKSAVTTTASISLATQNSAVKLTPSFSSETQNSAVTLTPSISSATQNSAVTLKPSISSATQKSTVIPTTSIPSATPTSTVTTLASTLPATSTSTVIPTVSIPLASPNSAVTALASTLPATPTSTVIPTASIPSASPNSTVTAPASTLPATPISTVTPTASFSSITPSIAMVIKPPPLRPVTSPAVTSSLQRCITGSCCTYGLSQLPARLSFEESETRGYVISEIRDISDVSFSVKVIRPFEMTTLLKDSFNVTTTRTGYTLVLSREIDLEELYDKTDGKVDVHNLQVQISCTENSSIIVPPRMLNITVDDVDDSMPVFIQPGTNSGGCVVPVYKADTSEDYMGELALSPGKIQAVDGDVSSSHNISYRVLHSEPADYHVHFSLDTDNGTIHKTKTMNSSDPNKYVIFVQAVEDSPQQKSRVALLSIVVVAPSDPFTNPNQVNPNARLALQIACTFILMAFICGVVVIVHHRYTRSRGKVESLYNDEERDMKLPKLAVYQSSNSSLNSAMPDIPTISSPSMIVVGSNNTLKPELRESESQKRRRIIVKKPMDTKSRPSWNAPPPRPKRTRYNPFSVYKTQHAK